MLLLPLALGWLLLAADPAPSDPARIVVRPSGSASDLADLARLAPRGRPAPVGATEPAEYAVESAARGTLVFLLPPGPRIVRALEVLPDPATAGAWRNARLRMTWEDDDPDPRLAGLDLPLGLAFGRAEGLPPAESVAVGTTGRSWVNRFPMPYRNLALLVIDAEQPLRGRIVVRSTRGVAADAGYFRGAVRASGSLASRATADRIGETGRGRLAGVFLVTEVGIGSDRHAETPRFVVDGRPVDPLADALGRKLPGAGGPVAGVLAATPGAVDRSAAYRWFLADPIVFRRSFAVEQAGALGAVVAGQGVTVRRVSGMVAAFFWYSDRPSPGRVGR